MTPAGTAAAPTVARPQARGPVVVFGSAMAVRLSSAPGWALALAVYLATRVVATVMTLAAAHSQAASLWVPEDPGYQDFVSMWDGERYRTIAEQGYPIPLPMAADGEPDQSEWAFFPAYPMLVRAAMAATGTGFREAAPVVSLVCGCAAAVLVHALFRRRAGRAQALLGVAVLGVFPAAAVLQYSYSEALCLLALAASLHTLTSRWYAWCLPAVAVLGLTRPIGLPFALVVGAHLLVRWRNRRDDPFPAREAARVVLVGAVGVVAALLMPVATGVVAGRADGYTAVQVAWRVQDHMEYFTPWAWMADFVFGRGRGTLALIVLVLLVVGVLASPPARRLGVEMWSWCAAYAVYLAAILDPFTSLPRFLLLFFPLALALVTAPRRWWTRALLLIAWLTISVWLQWRWVSVLWVFAPPSDYPP